MTKIGINFQSRENKYTSVYLLRSSMEMGPIHTLFHPCAKLLLPCLAALTLTSADPGFVTLSRRGLVVLVNASPNINLCVSLTQISDISLDYEKLQQWCLLPSTIFALLKIVTIIFSKNRVNSGNVGRLCECEQSCKFGAV